MKDRINEIVKVIPECEFFADIGCDHGYCTERMLREGKCKRAVIADISKKCLFKAEKLLENYMEQGKVTSVVSDGFESIPDVDTALIAGLGGEEIISIMKRAEHLPENMVLQPMKNCDKVRKFSVEIGYKIIKDFVAFCEEKFYNIIVLKKGRDTLTEEETEFGRTDILYPSSDFVKMIKVEIEKFTLFAENAKGEAKKELIKKVERLKKYVKY